MQKIFLFLLLSIVRLIAKVGASSWYREAQRSSGQTAKTFATGSIISVMILLLMAIVAVAVRF